MLFKKYLNEWKILSEANKKIVVEERQSYQERLIKLKQHGSDKISAYSKFIAMLKLWC